MPSTSVSIGGVDVPPVSALAEHPSLASRLLGLRDGAVVHELRLGGFPVECDGGDLAVERAPGLHVGAVNRNRA
jgi:hypothetical protein